MSELPPATLRTLATALRKNPTEFALDLGTGMSWWVRGPLRKGPACAGDGPTVVLMRGVWEPTGYLATLSAALTESGYCVHEIPGLGINLSPVSELADVVATYVREHDLHDIVIVGHSKGGLVAKALLLGPERPRFRGAVTISTPFHGSSWARLLPQRFGVDGLIPGCDELTALNDDSVNHLITSITTDHDIIIPEGSHLDGARNVKLDMVGHYLPLSDVGGLEVVREEIAARFGSPAPITVERSELRQALSEWSFTLQTQLPRDELRRRLFDATRHEAAVPLTRIEPTDADRLDQPGLTYVAITARVFRDAMRVKSATRDEVVIRKIGPVLTGEVRVTLTGEEKASLTWAQDVQVRTLPSFLRPLVSAVGRRLYSGTVRRIVEMSEPPAPRGLRRIKSNGQFSPAKTPGRL